jgi:hypothetical protein
MTTIPRPRLVSRSSDLAAEDLPEQVTIALHELAGAAKEGLLAFSVGIGLAVPDELFEAEVSRLAGPQAVPGSAVDPITLMPVDEVVVTTLVDNVYDALLDGQGTHTRAPIAAGIAQAPQFESGTTHVGLMAATLASLPTPWLPTPTDWASTCPT